MEKTYKLSLIDRIILKLLYFGFKNKEEIELDYNTASFLKIHGIL